jgi:predicted XRE-type DNA-binding protein
MKSSDGEGAKTARVTRGSVLDDLGFSPSEALEIKVKAEIYRELLQFIRDQGIAARELAIVLDGHQPDVSNLLNGRISKFSVGKLIQCAEKWQPGVQIKLTKPSTRSRALPSKLAEKELPPPKASRPRGSRKERVTA